MGRCTLPMNHLHIMHMHFSAFNARHIITSQRNLLFPESACGGSVNCVRMIKKQIDAVNCRGRTSFLIHLSLVYVSHSIGLTEIEQCCIFISFFTYCVLSIFYCFFNKVRGCVVYLVGHGSCIMGHGSVFVWVSSSWVTVCYPLFTLAHSSKYEQCHVVSRRRKLDKESCVCV